MKQIAFIIIFFLLHNLSFSQNSDCGDTYDFDAHDLYQEALKIKKFNRNKAEKLLLQSIKYDSKYVKAYFLLGEIYFIKAKKNKDEKKKSLYYSQSIKAFKKVIKLCNSSNSYESYYYIGIALYNQRKYEESRSFLVIFKNRTKKFLKIKEIDLLLENINEYLNLTNHPIDYKPIPLLGVNTKNDEYYPMLSPDGDYIWYTRGFNSENEEYKELFYKSKKLSPKGEIHEKYTYGEPMPNPFNDGRTQGAASVTVDNNKMFISICGTERAYHRSYVNCDIYTSNKVNGKWDKLERLGKQINTKLSFESQPSISPDGRTLYFSSARENGFGKIDIYKSVMDENNVWQAAQNLGAVINTKGNDKSPFIHPDGKTLYFASDGRFGMGGFDIYFSRYNKKTGWSKPQNIGYPVNTENDEIAFYVSTNGKRLYFSSNKINKKKNWDIFSTIMPEKAAPLQVLLVKGKISGDDGDTLTRVDVKIQNTRTLEETKAFVEEKTGNYAVSVPVEKNDTYMLSAHKKGYFHHNEVINPSETKYVPPSELNIKVKKIQTNIPRILKNVYFETNKYELNDIAKICIKDLMIFLEENPTVSIEIRGHTDKIGSKNYNYELSKNRAKAVHDYLITQGIDKKRLKYKALGEAFPTKSNNTEEGRLYNRRVEFIVTKK